MVSSSSADSEKSSTDRFSVIRSRRVDLGMTGRPRCTHQRIRTWAAVRPVRWAIAATLVVGGGAVEKHINNIFTKLGLEPGERDHRRVLAVLRYLGTG